MASSDLHDQMPWTDLGNKNLPDFFLIFFKSCCCALYLLHNIKDNNHQSRFNLHWFKITSNAQRICSVIGLERMTTGSVAKGLTLSRHTSRKPWVVMLMCIQVYLNNF